jgi:hypothetical protein
LTIPIGALNGILARCLRRGLVQKRENVYHPIRKKLDKMEFATIQAAALRQHRSLLDKLRAFAEAQYDLEWSEGDADGALLGYLQERSVSVLAAATEGDPLPASKRQSRRTKHVMSAFAGYVSESDPDGFACLETVVKGYVLSGVLFYPDLGQIEARFEDLAVYCDTPFLLPAIGFSEEGRHFQSIELLELLRDLGARLKCFHHTIEEIAGVLETEAAGLRDAASEPTEYSTTKRFRRHEIEELIFKLPEILRALGIEVVDTPTWTDTPDEVALEESIQKKINYLRPKAREKDVKSLAAICRLRGGRRMPRLESAKAVFLTTNTTLARASSTFFRDLEANGAIPLCMPVPLMARLAWVKKPMAAPQLPRHMVMASSYAALNPSHTLWREYLAEVARRKEKGEVSDEEYHFLRFSHEARKALMDRTLGDEDAFTAGTVDEVLEHAKRQFQAEAKAETEEERTRRLAAEADARSSRALAENIVQAHHDEADRQAHLIGALGGGAFAAVVGLAVLVGAIATIPGAPLLEIDTLGWRILVWVCLAAFVLITLYAVEIKHVPVKELQRAIAARIERAWGDRAHRKLDALHQRAGDGDVR